MKHFALLFICTSLLVACGSSSSISTASKTNVNTANKTSYSQTENAYTFAQNSDLAGALAPSGKEAREIVGKTLIESRLWQNKMFDERLRKLMGPDYATMRKLWNTETPIEKFGDFLMMTGCEQEECARNQFVIFVDLGDGRINVIHITRSAVREWHGYREIEYLPPPFEEKLKKLKLRN